MAFSDPQSITIDGVTTSLPRVFSEGYESKYQGANGLVVLEASSQFNTRTRQLLRINQTKTTSDPYIPANNREVSMSCYMVFDRPNVGFTDDDAFKLYTGFNSMYTASTSALVKKVLAGES